MDRDPAFLLDILISAKDIKDFTKDYDMKRFLGDRKCQFAVIRCLELIGEAVKRLSPETINDHSDVPWSDTAKMRDLLIHAYDKIDLDKVWDTVEKDIPVLIEKIEKITPSEDQS